MGRMSISALLGAVIAVFSVDFFPKSERLLGLGKSLEYLLCILSKRHYYFEMRRNSEII